MKYAITVGAVGLVGYLVGGVAAGLGAAFGAAFGVGLGIVLGVNAVSVDEESLEVLPSKDLFDDRRRKIHANFSRN